jgi:hypothetical protein
LQNQCGAQEAYALGLSSFYASLPKAIRSGRRGKFRYAIEVLDRGENEGIVIPNEEKAKGVAGESWPNTDGIGLRDPRIPFLMVDQNYEISFVIKI